MTIKNPSSGNKQNDQRERPVGLTTKKNNIMTTGANEYFKKIKEIMNTPEYQEEMKKPNFPTEEFNAFLIQWNIVCLIESIFLNRDEFVKQIDKVLKETGLDQKINELIEDVLKSAGVEVPPKKHKTLKRFNRSDGKGF